ncbi:hypothetical protein MXD81_27065, partial [Microbacteriaceae bacterium K1510]|nr:hypothetical protein [Microbacteriaceae bacterium K1510]
LMLLCYTGVIIGKQAEQLANGEGSWMIASVLLPCCLAFWLILQGWRQLTRFASAILLLVLLLISLLFTEQRHIPIPSFS